MVTQTADKSTSNAKSYTKCDPGYCLKYVRTWLEIASRDASAIEAWHNADHRHPNDRNPPRGAPMFYQGGNYGHIVLSLNNRESDNKQMIRSTDAPSSGKVTTQTIDWCPNNWGYDYLGWTEDLNGIWIPYLRNGGGQQDWRSHGDVYVSKLHKGQQDSDSVSRLRYRLQNHDKMPGSHKPGYGAGYGQECLEAVRYWQKNIMNPDTKGPKDGTSLSNQQANKLFGDNYHVIEK